MQKPILSRGERLVYIAAATLFASSMFITIYDFAVAS